MHLVKFQFYMLYTNFWSEHISVQFDGICFHMVVFPARGATSSSFRGGAIFMNFHSMTSSCLFNRCTTFSQTVTYNNNVFLPPETTSIVQTHIFCTTLVNKTDKTERFATALEAESPVLSEISDFTPYAHAQSNILHIKYAEKTYD